MLTISSRRDSLWDMIVHNPPSRQDLLDLDEAEAYKHLYERLKFYSPPEPSDYFAQYGHFMAGYDGGYYSYIW
jgi:Zn-dependent oligopeptidase